MPYKVKGKCVYKKDTGAKVGCTKGSVDKYLAALHANAKESVNPLKENLNYVDMFNKEYLLVRIPFLKDYKFFKRNNGIEAQRVIYHENVTKLYNKDIINFKQFNVSSEFVFYVQRIDDRTFYHFIIKNQFHPQIENGQLDGLEEKVLLLAINQIGEKLSYSDELMVKDGQSIDEDKLDEIFNKINEILFKVEKETEENNTPLFEGNTIKGGKADKMSLKDIAKKFNVSVNKIQAQLQKGIKAEMEHTKDKEKATEIAMDHLTEFPDYYDRLGKMEKTAEKKWEVNESQRQLIKRLLREEIEEGSLARTLGTLGMAASTLASPNINAKTTDPFKIEKSDRVGVIKNSDGSITSIAKTDGPTKDMAKELAIGKAKVQIVSKLDLESTDFNYDVVNVKYEKGKNNIICTVEIVARIK